MQRSTGAVTAFVKNSRRPSADCPKFNNGASKRARHRYHNEDLTFACPPRSTTAFRPCTPRIPTMLASTFVAFESSIHRTPSESSTTAKRNGYDQISASRVGQISNWTTGGSLMKTFGLDCRASSFSSTNRRLCGTNHHDHLLYEDV